VAEDDGAIGVKWRRSSGRGDGRGEDQGEKEERRERGKGRKERKEREERGERRREEERGKEREIREIRDMGLPGLGLIRGIHGSRRVRPQVTMEALLFHVFSAVARTSARGVMRLPHPVHAVLSLIVSFVSACALMRLLQVEFMALIFVVVYVGAIAVLFLFVVMLRNLNASSSAGNFRRRDGGATGARFGSLRARAGVGSWATSAGLTDTRGIPLEAGAGVGEGHAFAYVSWVDRLDPRTSAQTLGQVLYTHWFVYLLLAGFVLLVARIGAIVLTLKVRTFARAKRQHVHQQRSRDAERAIMRTRVVRGEDFNRASG